MRAFGRNLGAVPFMFAKKEKPKTPGKARPKPLQTMTCTKVARENTDRD